MTSIHVKVSIIVVCLNAGKDLEDTVNSILKQTYDNYEVIIKDGLSTDGSIEKLPEDERIRFFSQKDTGIYDAMNQAIEKCTGNYIFFLNCGDLFYSDSSLQDIYNGLIQNDFPDLLYGNYFNLKFNQIINSPSKLVEFYLYRTVLCHQSCVFKHDLFKKYGKFDLNYKVFADYELLVKFFVLNKIIAKHADIIISSYKGDGYSERDDLYWVKRNEHSLIKKTYFSTLKQVKYFVMICLSLPILRNYIFTNKFTRKFYIKLLNFYYKQKK